MDLEILMTNAFKSFYMVHSRLLKINSYLHATMEKISAPIGS